MIEIVNTLVKDERYNPDEADGWIDGEPYYLLNPRLHRESLRIDYGLRFVKYRPELNLDMYAL